jgi:hypothetical protein
MNTTPDKNTSINTNINANAAKKSNLRVALVPISLALMFGLGFVLKQIVFG